MPLSNEEVEWVLAAPKQVTQQIEWTTRPGRTLRHECIFSVRIPDRSDPQMAVLGKIEASSTKYETRCAFVYRGVCIRRWESRGRHRNPDGERIVGEHKHDWDEVHEDRRAYIPTDIDTDSRDSILMGFLAECGITIEGPGAYAPELPGIGGDS